MPKELMNEAERFLIEHWGEARLLEESMEGLRAKYKEVFQRIINAVKEGHAELDTSAAYPTQFWGEGYIGFGRKSWPGGETWSRLAEVNRWPSGLWVRGVRLEHLAAEDSEPLRAYLSFSHISKSKLDFDAARAVVYAAAKELLAPEELKGTTSPDVERVLLYLPTPSKRQLLGALCDGDGEAFVKLFVAEFDMMARFVPVLDTVFREHAGTPAVK